LGRSSPVAPLAIPQIARLVISPVFVDVSQRLPPSAYLRASFRCATACGQSRALADARPKFPSVSAWPVIWRLLQRKPFLVLACLGGIFLLQTASQVVQRFAISRINLDGFLPLLIAFAFRPAETDLANRWNATAFRLQRDDTFQSSAPSAVIQLAFQQRQL
jgi:hypothetical protein